MPPVEETIKNINKSVSALNESAGSNLAPLEVDAVDLTKPTPAPKIPEPAVATQPSQFVGTMTPAVEQGQQGLIEARTKEAEQRGDVLGRLLEDSPASSMDIFKDSFDTEITRMTGATPETFLKQLADANTNLAMLQGKFRTQAQDISGGEGQSKVFGNAQLGELSREEAVQVGNQALLVQALQGNFNTARQIALDTAKFASDDRKAELNNLIAQFNALDGIVSDQEQQLLDQAKAEAEAEKAELERTQAAVDSAITSGAATVEEMQQLTSTTVSDAQKQALAQSIVARGAVEDRSLDRQTTGLQQTRLRQQISTGSIQQRAALVDLAASGDQQAINQLGYDPRNVPLSRNELDSVETTNVELTRDLDTIQALRQNKTGINLSAGTLQGGDPEAGFFGRPLSGLASLLETGLKGGGFFSAKNLRENFLSDISQLTGKYTLQNLIDKKEEGATFGSLDRAELVLLSDSSTKLNSLLRKNDAGEVVGIKGTEENLRDALEEFESRVLQAKDKNNAQILSNDEFNEIVNQ